MTPRKRHSRTGFSSSEETPHQKWGTIYSDNPMMLTLNRGGPLVWLSEDDAREAGIEDNDWIGLYNAKPTQG